MRTIHAPSEALVTACTMQTIAVATAPTPLMITPRRHPRCLRRMKCLTIPDCDSVNEEKQHNHAYNR